MAAPVIGEPDSWARAGQLSRRPPVWLQSQNAVQHRLSSLRDRMYSKSWCCPAEEPGYCSLNSPRQMESLHRGMQAFPQETSYRMLTWNHPSCDLERPWSNSTTP